MNVPAMVASGIWGLLMAVVITPAAGLTEVQNMVSVVGGAVIITILMSK